MSEFAVEMRDVVKTFQTPEGGTINAVDHVDMQIKNGEFFSLSLRFDFAVVHSGSCFIGAYNRAGSSGTPSQAQNFQRGLHNHRAAAARGLPGRGGIGAGTGAWHVRGIRYAHHEAENG